MVQCVLFVLGICLRLGTMLSPAKCDVLHHGLPGETQEMARDIRYNCCLGWKLQDLPTEPSCPVMILVVGVTVLENGHAVNHRIIEIATDSILNYNNHINNPNK